MAPNSISLIKSLIDVLFSDWKFKFIIQIVVLMFLYVEQDVNLA